MAYLSIIKEVDIKTVQLHLQCSTDASGIQILIASFT